MKKETVLLTGGAGFIGSHVAEAYIAEGYKVVIVDDLSTGDIQNISAISDNSDVFFCKCDIRDKKALGEIFNTHKPSIVNHHAAQKSIPASVADPLFDCDLNMRGLLNILETIKEHPVKNFIYISSGGALSKEIIGTEKSSETDKPQLESPYAITKFAGENYVRIYAAIYGFGYTILRYANIYGLRQTASGECGVIPIFVGNILEGRQSVLLTYDDMPRGCTRDYVNVKDVANINMLVTKNITNDIFNVGSGIEIGILDIYEEIKEVFKSDLDIIIKGPRLGDVRRSLLDNSKAKSVLGWSPSVSLTDGLTEIYNAVVV